MALDTLTAKANVGAGTDGLAGRSTAAGFVGAVMLVDPAGIEFTPALATNQETANDTLASIDAKLPAIGEATPVKNVEVETTGAITANSQRVSATVSTGNAVAIQLDGTHAGANLTFELSNNGTVWDLTTAVRSGTASPLTATGVLASNGTTLWHLYCGAAQFVSVRSTAFTSGSLNVRFRAISIGSPTAVVVQPSGTQPVSGTVTATVTAGTVNPVVPATPYFLNSAATTNGALIITGTSGLQAFYATNIGATAAFVKLYNKASAPTVGTDTPEMIIYVPAAVAGVPGVATLPIGFSGFRFALGLGIAITGAVADSDTTAVAAGQVKVKLSRTV